MKLRFTGAARSDLKQQPHRQFSETDLARAFSPRTKVVLFNNPLNPAGVVYDRQDLALLAKACVDHDAVAVCDEVWEHVVFDGTRHLSLMALPGMAERTVKIGSGGKIFSLTVWKVGFVVAPGAILRVLAKTRQT